LRKFFEFQNTPGVVDPMADQRSYEQRRLDPRPAQPRAEQRPEITPR